MTAATPPNGPKGPVTPPKAAPPKASRMGLAQVTTRAHRAPERLVLSGTEGVGKTLWACSAPSPIYLGPEDGLPFQVASTPRFPRPESWIDILEAVNVLRTETHEYKTLVIDTVDWIEPFVWRYLCAKHKVDSIEKVLDGFGKGYTEALSEWRRLLNGCDLLREQRGMRIILCAHTHVKVYQNPLGEPYDRFELKIHKGAAALISEWADAVFFAHQMVILQQQTTKKGKKIGRAKAQTGQRVLETVRTAAWNAKNRYGLPERLPLDWDDFQEAMKASGGEDDRTARVEAIRALCIEYGNEETTKAIEAKIAAGASMQLLTSLENKLQVKLAEKREVEADAAEPETPEEPSGDPDEAAIQAEREAAERELASEEAAHQRAVNEAMEAEARDRE